MNRPHDGSLITLGIKRMSRFQLVQRGGESEFDRRSTHLQMQVACPKSLLTIRHPRRQRELAHIARLGAAHCIFTTGC